MSQRGGAPGGDGAVQTAAFNARTGRFAPADTSYTYDHLDEYNRMKRMSSHYFDVEAWEKQRQEEQAKRRREEAEGVAPKKITRKDMVSGVVASTERGLWKEVGVVPADSRAGLRDLMGLR